MVRKIKNTLLAITVLTVLGMEAQVAPAWNKLFNKAVVWQKVFSSGNYLVSTHDNFFLIDQETGDAVWSNSKFTDIPQSSVSELKGSFLFEINKEDVTYLLDPFSGKSKFDSKSSGISKLEHKQVLGLSGNLFVAGVSDGENQKIINVDLESGKIIWELREKFGKIISLNELNANEFLMVSLFNSYRINSKTGEVIWKKKNSDDNDKLDKLGKFGSLLKDVATAAAKDMDFNTKFYLNKEKNIFILGTQEETVTTSPNGDDKLVYTTTFQGMNISDGGLIWKKPLKVNGKFGSFAFLGNDIIILPNNDLSSRVNRFQLGSNIGEWGKKGRGVKVKGGVYSHSFTDLGILIISKKGSKNLMTMLDTKTGLAKYKKPIKIGGSVQRTFNVEGKVLYQTNYEINIFDPVTGVLSFSNSLSTTPKLTVQRENDLLFFEQSSGLVQSINLKDGSIKKISVETFKFGGKESVKNIELRGEEIFLSSDQNVVLIGSDGKIKFNKYYAAPKVSGLKQALLYAQAARAAYIGVASYAISASMNQASSELKSQDKVASDITGALGSAYGEIGNQASSFAKQSFKQANQRFKASKGGRDFVIIISKEKKGNSLLKVSKKTGEVLKELSLGKDKQPSYAVDEITGNIFLKTKTAIIVGYKF